MCCSCRWSSRSTVADIPSAYGARWSCAWLNMYDAEWCTSSRRTKLKYSGCSGIHFAAELITKIVMSLMSFVLP